MKKVERYIYIILIVILVGILSAGTTYIIMKNNDKTEIKENSNQNEEPTKQDGVKLLKTYNLNDKIIEEFEITLNGKTNNMKIEFDYDEDTEEYEGEVLNIVDGKFNKNNIVCYFETSSTKSKMFNLNIIKNKFNENNFKIVKGTDSKSYLLLATNNACGAIYESKLLIFNDDLEQIKGNFDGYAGSCSKAAGMTIATTSTIYFIDKNDTTPNYNNDFNIDLSEYQLSGVYVKIENDKIYYLAPVLNDNGSEGNYGTIEERIYTINDNKLEYQVIKTYKIINGAGQIC